MKIKVCGITRIDDGRIAAEAGADMLGFIFFPPSSRYLSPADAREVILGLPPEIDKVGVFVNEPVAKIAEIAEHCGLDRVQLHGEEPLDHLHALRRFAPIKGIGLAEPADVQRLLRFRGFTWLVDTPCPNYGGSGVLGNWELACQAAEQGPTILAGGLTPENIADAIHTVSPWGVDVSSGVEVAKGIKDHALIREFVATARAASA